MSYFKDKCTKFDFSCVSALDPAGGDYSAPQTIQMDLWGPVLRGRERREWGLPTYYFWRKSCTVVRHRNVSIL